VSGGCVSPLYHGSGRVCVCACVYALKVARVDMWAGGACLCVLVDGLRLCGHVFNLYVWGGCGCVFVCMRSVCGWWACLYCVYVAKVCLYCPGGPGGKTNRKTNRKSAKKPNRFGIIQNAQSQEIRGIHKIT
jgi:hypothetical protein